MNSLAVILHIGIYMMCAKFHENQRNTVEVAI